MTLKSCAPIVGAQVLSFPTEQQLLSVGGAGVVVGLRLKFIGVLCGFVV